MPNLTKGNFFGFNNNRFGVATNTSTQTGKRIQIQFKFSTTTHREEDLCFSKGSFFFNKNKGSLFRPFGSACVYAGKVRPSFRSLSSSDLKIETSMSNSIELRHLPENCSLTCGLFYKNVFIIRDAVILEYPAGLVFSGKIRASSINNDKYLSTRQELPVSFQFKGSCPLSLSLSHIPNPTYGPTINLFSFAVYSFQRH